MMAPAPSEPTSQPERMPMPSTAEAPHQGGRADDVVGVALARGVFEAPQHPGSQRQHEQVTVRDEAQQRQRAERAGGEGLAHAGHHQQPAAREAIGERAGRGADEEEGQGAHAHRHAHEEQSVGELQREPAEDDDLAHHAD